MDEHALAIPADLNLVIPKWMTAALAADHPGAVVPASNSWSVTTAQTDSG
ncbi:hypothetical protein [Amycolatopsis sp. RTGN1]|nr:hypothetical protein [Amycolatopsis sp. RTGN1]